MSCKTCGDCKWLIEECDGWYCDNEESFFQGIGFDPKQSVAELACSVSQLKNDDEEQKSEYESPNQGHFEFE
ncbi:MAG: hypothetical protein LBF71_02670 [Campylobacteraceae bacterium]|jgi:hypothetical protein|nr:hypothetical protein [Campylobacteraceae bacterium]